MRRRVDLGSSFGVMQGRLSVQTNRGYQAFPSESWLVEFQKAKELQLEHIEWIFDRHADWQNPLICNVKAVNQAIQETGVRVLSVCADIFMEFPLDVHEPSSFDLLERILLSMRAVNADLLVLPCVDEASLLDNGNLRRLESSLPKTLEMATKARVQIALESDLPPATLLALLERYPAEVLGVNYDSGNSASLGYKWPEEQAAYGARITLVHIKDRTFLGPSVPLGSGDADLLALLRWIQTDFRGPVTLQAFRDEEGVGVLARQIEWLKSILEARK